MKNRINMFIETDVFRVKVGAKQTITNNDKQSQINFQRFSKHFSKLFKEFQADFKTIQSISKQFKAFQNISKQFKTIQNNSKQFKTIQNKPPF